MNAVVENQKARTDVPTLSIVERMGKLLGLKLHSEQDEFLLVKHGLRSKSIEALIKEINVSASLIGSETTVRRRLKEKSLFSEAESERALRLTRVFVLAEALFGTKDAALEWLNAPGDWIKGSPPISPMELSAKDAGARLIEASIMRTAHGIY